MIRHPELGPREKLEKHSDYVTPSVTESLSMNEKSVTRACNKLTDTCARPRWQLPERTEHAKMMGGDLGGAQISALRVI